MFGYYWWGVDVIYVVGVVVLVVFDYGDVDVDDVVVFEDFGFVGNVVVDDVVYWCVDGFWEVLVVDVGWCGFLYVDDVVVVDVV